MTKKVIILISLKHSITKCKQKIVVLREISKNCYNKKDLFKCMHYYLSWDFLNPYNYHTSSTSTNRSYIIDRNTHIISYHYRTLKNYKYCRKATPKGTKISQENVIDSPVILERPHHIKQITPTCNTIFKICKLKNDD